jgi:hypothetical protein
MNCRRKPRAKSSPQCESCCGQPDFLRLWLVGAFANAMRWLELLASGLFAYEVTGSALAVTGVVAARQLPQLLFGAFAGAVSEAVDRKLIVMLALLVPAAVATVLATLATTGISRCGMSRSATWPPARCGRPRCRRVGAWWARSPAAHHPGDRPRFLDQCRDAHDRSVARRLRLPVARHEGRLHGDRAGAVRRRLRHGGTGASPGDAPSHDARIPADIVDGLRFRRTRPLILLVFGVTVVTNAFAFSYSGLVAPLGLGAFHVSPALVGLLAAGEPIGALLGGALIAPASCAWIAG